MFHNSSYNLCSYASVSLSVSLLTTLSSLKNVYQLYFERDMPPKPPLPTIFDIIQLNAAARRVQNMWVIHQCEKRAQEENERSEEYIHRLSI